MTNPPPGLARVRDQHSPAERSSFTSPRSHFRGSRLQESAGAAPPCSRAPRRAMHSAMFPCPRSHNARRRDLHRTSAGSGVIARTVCSPRAAPPVVHRRDLHRTSAGSGVIARTGGYGRSHGPTIALGSPAGLARACISAGGLRHRRAGRRRGPECQCDRTPRSSWSVTPPPWRHRAGGC